MEKNIKGSSIDSRGTSGGIFCFRIIAARFSLDRPVYPKVILENLHFFKKYPSHSFSLVNDNKISYQMAALKSKIYPQWVISLD